MLICSLPTPFFCAGNPQRDRPARLMPEYVARRFAGERFVILECVGDHLIPPLPIGRCVDTTLAHRRVCDEHVPRNPRISRSPLRWKLTLLWSEEPLVFHCVPFLAGVPLVACHCKSPRPVYSTGRGGRGISCRLDLSSWRRSWWRAPAYMVCGVPREWDEFRPCYTLRQACSYANDQP